jgi:hypothetical protein
MNTLNTSLLAAVACCIGASAFALDLASSTASSASSAGSASVGSASDSLRGSSNSSAGPRQMAAGHYRIIQVTAAPDDSERWRLTLAGPETAGSALPGAEGGAVAVQWNLQVPRTVAEREGLTPGLVLRAAPQAYGVSFAVTGQTQPFFLVLTEEWQRELPARPVGADRGA